MPFDPQDFDLKPAMVDTLQRSGWLHPQNCEPQSPAASPSERHPDRLIAIVQPLYLLARARQFAPVRCARHDDHFNANRLAVT